MCPIYSLKFVCRLNLALYQVSSEQIGSSICAGGSSAMVMTENDVGLVKIGTILPSHVLLGLLMEHGTLPSDLQQNRTSA